MKQFKDYESIPEDYVPAEDLVAVGYGRNRWVEILSLEAVAPETGLYLMACKGDNHLTARRFHHLAQRYPVHLPEIA